MGLEVVKKGLMGYRGRMRRNKTRRTGKETFS